MSRQHLNAFHHCHLSGARFKDSHPLAALVRPIFVSTCLLLSTWSTYWYQIETYQIVQHFLQFTRRTLTGSVRDLIWSLLIPWLIGISRQLLVQFTFLLEASSFSYWTGSHTDSYFDQFSKCLCCMTHCRFWESSEMIYLIKYSSFSQ